MFTVQGILYILNPKADTRPGLHRRTGLHCLGAGPTVLNRQWFEVRRDQMAHQYLSFCRGHIQVKRTVDQDIGDLFFLFPGYFNELLPVHKISQNIQCFTLCRLNHPLTINIAITLPKLNYLILVIK